MSRTLLVQGDKNFKIEVPDNAKITFGPWSPPRGDTGAHRFEQQGRPNGTLRIYDGTNVIAVFSGVTGYRDMGLKYLEEVAKEEGATVWKSDHEGYVREEKYHTKSEWVGEDAPKRIRAPRKPAAAKPAPPRKR
jgi:hypothetical protein